MDLVLETKMTKNHLRTKVNLIYKICLRKWLCPYFNMIAVHDFAEIFIHPVLAFLSVLKSFVCLVRSIPSGLSSPSVTKSGTRWQDVWNSQRHVAHIHRPYSLRQRRVSRRWDNYLNPARVQGTSLNTELLWRNRDQDSPTRFPNSCNRTGLITDIKALSIRICWRYNGFITIFSEDAFSID